jgi:hypothetical protein
MLWRSARAAFLSAILAHGYRLEIHVCATVGYMSMKGMR